MNHAPIKRAPPKLRRGEVTRRSLRLPITAAEFSATRRMSPPAVAELVQQIECACRDAREEQTDAERARQRLLRACYRYRKAQAARARAESVPDATTARIRVDAPVGAQQTTSAPVASPPPPGMDPWLDAIERGLDEVDPLRFAGKKAMFDRRAGGVLRGEQRKANSKAEAITTLWDKKQQAGVPEHEIAGDVAAALGVTAGYVRKLRKARPI